MKKFTFRGLLAALLLFCFAPSQADTTFKVTDDNGVEWTYTVVGGGNTDEDGNWHYNVALSNVYPNDSVKGDLVIPDTVRVSNAFGSPYDAICTVTQLGTTGSLFSSCKGITSVTIPGQITYIARNMFTYCYNIKSVVIEDGDGGMFIDYSAFYSCVGLDTVYIGNSVKAIGEDAFGSCMSLKEVTIPSSVDSIYHYAFSYCDSLKKVTINGNGNTGIGTYAFYSPNSNPPSGYGTYGTKTRPLETVVINGVSTIGSHAFYNSGIKSLTLGEGLLTIDDTAFEEDDFTEVILPNSVQTIGSYAFESDSLQRVTIGTDVTSIATRAFAQLNNGSLTTVNYNAKNCTTIGSDAFNNGPITTVTIGEDVESIPTGLFNYTNDGTNRDGSTYNYGFHIQTVNYNAKNCTQPCTRTENYDENGLKYYTYSDFPFENSSSTIKTVTIGDSVESIPGYLFHNCTALETVHFNAAHCHQAGDSVVYKNYYADQNSSVKAMAKARSLAATADMQGEWYVPQSVAAAADPATTQLLSASSKRKIIAYAGEEDDGDDEKDYENEEDYRDGRDIYTPYSDAIIYYPVFGGCTKLKTLDMGKHVHRVPEALCYNASSLSDLTIGDSVVYIGRVAFNGCGLTTLTIPEGVEDMEDNVFENNTSLTTVNYYARNCNLAGHFDYDDTEENTNYWFTTFSGCSNLTTFNVENTVDTIPNVLCLCVSSLVNLDLGTNVKKIYRGAFEKCSSLPSVTFPSSLKVLGINSFRDDSTLVAVTIPATIDSIYAGAFESCVKLATVYAPAAPPYCESTAFYEIADDSWLVVPEDYACAYTTDDKFQATKATKTGWNDIDNLREDKVSLTPLSANDYYTTCYSPYEYTLDPGVKGAIIQSVTESDSQSYTDDNVTEYTLTISWDYDGDDDSKNVVPAGTALLIKGTAETTYADSTRNATETKVTGNLMGGSTKLNSDDSTVTTTAGDGNSDSDYYFYRLTYGNKSPFDALLGFYRMDTDGSPFNITKKKAWLAIPKSQIDVSGANLPLISFVESDGSDSDVNLEIGIDSDGETTGISSLASEGVAGAVIYNMAGQRVNDMNRKGIYIISGKKVIKK